MTELVAGDRHRARTIIVTALSLCSGLLSAQLCLPYSRKALLPGLFFGILVLCPLVPFCALWPVRIAALVGLSVLAYWTMTWLAITAVLLLHPVSGIAIAGMLGAAIVLCFARYLTPLSFTRDWIVMALMFGLLGGGVIGYEITALLSAPLGSEETLADRITLTVGFVVWQVGVGVALSRGRRIADPSRLRYE